VAQAMIYSFCLIFMALGTQVPHREYFALKTDDFMLLNHILFGIIHIVCLDIILCHIGQIRTATAKSAW